MSLFPSRRCARTVLRAMVRRSPDDDEDARLAKCPELGTASLPLDSRWVYDLRACQNMTAAVYVPEAAWREWFGERR